MNNQGNPSASELAAGASPRRPVAKGGVVAIHQLTKDCIVLLASLPAALPSEGAAMIAGRASGHGRFRAMSWDDDAQAPLSVHVIAVRLPALADAEQSGKTLVLQGSETEGAAITVPESAGDAASFAAALRQQAGSHLSMAVKFLLDAFSSKASRQLPAVSSFLAVLLDRSAQEAGVVETCGAIDREGLLLQGWLRRPLGGRLRFLLIDNSLDEQEAICASFPRPDLEGRGHGMLALLRVRNLPRSLYFQGPDGFHRLTVLPNLAWLRDGEAQHHLHAMLPSLHLDEDSRHALRMVAQPGYAGADTVSTLDLPVRMTIDLAAHLPEAGWHITGWLLDPAGLASAVVLRAPDDMAERLDLHWTRVPREDVSASFRDDPLFQGRIHHDLHGFTVFMPHPGAPSEAWIELQLPGDRIAYMPVSPVAADGADGRRRLLESFDIRKQSAIEIVDRHVAPLFHAAKSAQKRSFAHRVLRASQSPGEIAAALVIPVVEPAAKTRLTVAMLAMRKPGRGVAPIFVCSPAIGNGANELQRELDFYDVDAEVLEADHAIDHCEALELGAGASSASNLIFLSPSTYPVNADWASALLSTIGTQNLPAAASPTLFYEDWSIAYAGFDDVRFSDDAPFAEALCLKAGYPRESLSGRPAIETLAASLDCCAMSRAAFERVNGFSAGYALARANGLDLFLRMRKAGVRVLWAPQVEAYALDEPNGGYWLRTGALVDGWSLRASWREHLPAMSARKDIIERADGKAQLPFALLDNGGDDFVRGQGRRSDAAPLSAA